MKPSRRASTRRRRKSLSASPQVGTPAAPSTPFSPVPRDAPRPPCPSGFDPDVWERVVDIAVAASAKDAGSGRVHATPGWATHTAAVAQETRRWDDVVHPETDASDATPAILRATSDAHEKKHAESLLVAARAAVAAVAAAADSEAVDPAPLVRFALLREDLTARESATDGDRAAGRGVAFAADVDTRTGSGDSKTESEKLATNARDDRKSSLVSLPERDAALRALAAVRDEHAAEVTRLCASQENYEAFIAAVARLGGVRDLLRRTASQARAQHDELVAAGAPVLAAEADCSHERATAERARARGGAARGRLPRRVRRRARSGNRARPGAVVRRARRNRRRRERARPETRAGAEAAVAVRAFGNRDGADRRASKTRDERARELVRRRARFVRRRERERQRQRQRDPRVRRVARARGVPAGGRARARDAALRGATPPLPSGWRVARGARRRARARFPRRPPRRRPRRGHRRARERLRFRSGIRLKRARWCAPASSARARARRGGGGGGAARRRRRGGGGRARQGGAARGGRGGRRPFVRRLRGLRGLSRTLVSRFRDAPRDARFDSAAAHRLHRGGGGGGPRRRRGAERTPE